MSLAQSTSSFATRRGGATRGLIIYQYRRSGKGVPGLPECLHKIEVSKFVQVHKGVEHSDVKILPEQKAKKVKVRPISPVL